MRGGSAQLHALSYGLVKPGQSLGTLSNIYAISSITFQSQYLTEIYKKSAVSLVQYLAEFKWLTRPTFISKLRQYKGNPDQASSVTHKIASTAAASLFLAGFKYTKC